jgi:hypothetical protein
MYKFFLVGLLSITSIRCAVVRSMLSEGDMIMGLKEALTQGLNSGVGALALKGGMNGRDLLSSMLPEGAGKVFNTLSDLGLSSEINRFTNTLGEAASASAKRATPIFLKGIGQLIINKPLSLLQGRANAATDYLRSSIGTQLTDAFVPGVDSVFNEYGINKQLNTFTESLPAFGNSNAASNFKLNFSRLIAKQISNSIFNKIQDEELRIRTKIEARKTALLQKVFAGLENKVYERLN